MFSFQQLPLVAFVDVSRFDAHLYSEVLRRSVVVYLQRLIQIRSQLFRDERLELEVHDHMAQVVPVVLHRENVALPLVVLPAAVVFFFLPVLVQISLVHRVVAFPLIIVQVSVLDALVLLVLNQVEDHLLLRLV